MDKRSKYYKLVGMLKDRHGEKVKLQPLKQMIAIEIGATERTITETLKMMLDLNLIIETDPFIFKIQ